MLVDQLKELEDDGTPFALLWTEESTEEHIRSEENAFSDDHDGWMDVTSAAERIESCAELFDTTFIT